MTIEQAARPMLISNLVKKLENAREAYYSGESIMTDAQFDALEDQLRERDPRNKYFKQARSNIKGGRKVKLPVALPSLSKIKADGSAKKWVSNNSDVELWASPKLDGISVIQWNKSGKQELFTLGRHNDSYDISVLLPVIQGEGKLPKGHMVRGELTLSNADFAKFKSEYSNPRNMVAGIATRAARSNEIHKAAKYLKFQVHGYIKPEIPLHQAIPQLKKYGFSPVTLKKISLKRGDIESKLLTELDGFRKKNEGNLDGLVLHRDDGADIRAFKGTDQEYESVVGKVVWQKSRYGKLTPVVELKEPVNIGGAEISRVTAHNAANVYNNGIGRGAIVKIVRSGDVIPKIIEVVKRVKPAMPRNIDWDWDENGTDIWLIGEDADVAAGVMVNFINTLKVDGTSSGLITKLYNNGVDSIDKLIKAKESTLQNAGLGPTQAKKLVSELSAKMKVATHPQMMAASGIFERGMGQTRFEKILEVYPEPELRQLLAKQSTFSDAIWEIPGFGEKIINNLYQPMKDYFKWIDKLKWSPAISSVVVNGSLSGQQFAFTGFRSAEMEERIKQAGGKVGGVTKTTTAVITNDVNSNSGKVQVARDRGIPILTPVQFEKKYLK